MGLRRGLIPGFIAERYRTSKYSGRLIAYAMFIDISGFTILTQDLMKHGKEGAEVLSGIINDVFTPSIEAIYKYRGFVSSFAGDAFTSIFQGKKAEYPLMAAFTINRLFDARGPFHTRYGDYTLRVKIGLSHGPLYYCIIPTNIHSAYFFRGGAIDGCSESIKLAGKMQIVADKAFVQRTRCELRKDIIKRNWYIVYPQAMDLAEPVNQEKSYGDIEACFFPKTVIEQRDIGEFREVVTCFIGFSAKGSYKKAIEQVIINSNNYGGYFNRVDFGDKGGVMLVLFGAPVAREKLYERAADFILSLNKIKNFNFRAGLGYGMTFSGFVGSEKRREFTALGSVANLSARLMMKAGTSEILTDAKMAELLDSYYDIRPAGTLLLKGFREKTGVFRLIAKKTSKSHISYSGEFIGRSRETARLRKLIEPIFKGRFAGAVYIEGNAGIGKSRFIADFIEKSKNCNFLYMPCDEILQRSFNPFISFFKDFFKQSVNNTEKQNLAVFNKIYTQIVQEVPKEEVRQELARARSFIGALIGLEWKDSLFSMLDAIRRYESTLFAVKSFIKTQALHKPAIIVLEDAHWIDNDSRELLQVIVRNITDYPLALIILCRPADDGSKFMLKELQTEAVCIKRLELAELGKNTIKSLVLQTLQAKSLPRETLDLIREKSGGNPFFIEQVIFYLRDKGLLNSDYMLLEESRQVPSGINHIIIARLDRLSTGLKDTIKTSSVLGRMFALTVLKEMLYFFSIAGNENDIAYFMEDGCKEQIWDALKESRYIFRHALIRDAVYEIILKKRLKAFHEAAGNIIEKLYKNNLKEHYEELAEHYERSDNREKAVCFIKEAADYAMHHYRNKKAIELYDRLLEYTGEEDGREESLIDIYLRKGSVLELLCRWDEAENAYRKALVISVKIKNPILTAECKITAGNLLRLAGKTEEAVKLSREGLKISQEASYHKGIAKSLRALGIIYYYHGEYEKALHCYSREMEINKRINDIAGIGISYSNIGLIHKEQGNYELALEYFSKDIEICRKTGNKRGIAISYGNIGNIFGYQANYLKAMHYYKKKLKICLEIGDIREGNNTVGNMGNIYFYLQKHDDAMGAYIRYLSLCKELGEKRGISLAYGNMANLYRIQGKRKKAMDYYQKKLAISSEIQDKKETGLALGHIGIMLQESGNDSEAMEKLSKWAEISLELGDKRGLSSAYANMGLIYGKKGDYKNALHYYGKMLEISRTLGNKRAISQVCGKIAFILADQGRYDEALAVCRDKTKICRDNDDRLGENEAQGQTGFIMLKMGDFPGSLKHLDPAIEIARKYKTGYDLAMFLECKAEALVNTGRCREAGICIEEALQIYSDLKKPAEILKARILKYKIERDAKSLKALLKHGNLNAEQEAMALYELWKITGDSWYRQKALDIYNQIIDKIFKMDYKIRIDELNTENN